MVYKRQLFFQYSRPSGCDTSKLLSDDLKNKLYYDGFQKMLYHYSHQKDLKTENVLGSFAVIETAFIAVKRRKIENDRKRENPWKK